MNIIKAQVNDMPAVRTIFKKYQKTLGVSPCFQNFDQELASLPGLYASPTGAIFLALNISDVIGCIAICPIIVNDKISKNTAELKRLFVHDNFKGKGIGKKLFHLAMNEAQNCGYKSIVLETMDTMTQATNLYINHGFKLISPYSDKIQDDVKSYRFDFSSVI